MKNIQLFNVSPSVPKEVRFLETLANNLWWCWCPDAIELFRRIDPTLWTECKHNPLKFFSELPPERLAELPADDGFIAHMEEVREMYEAHVVKDCKGGDTCAAREGVAYFSLEFGIHESVRIYSGGLGCLAGDHLKSASDLNLPLVAVGLMYRQGYFQQYLDDDGMQCEFYPESEAHNMPMTKVCDSDNKPIQISVPLPNGELRAEVWQVNVGRIPLFLLDANIPANKPEFRGITAQLYGGDQVMRIRQEILLGVGGVRALLAMGFDPHVYHLNEGHAAFLGLGRIAHLVQSQGIDAKTAFEVMSRTNIFTTHTPVPAGNETFPIAMLKPYFKALEPEVGVKASDAIRWGQAPGAGAEEEVSMTILGMRCAHFYNAVSKLHGVVARKMWSYLWPDLPVEEVPIGHVTNGVHISSWLSTDIAALFDRYLGRDWRDHPGDENVVKRIDRIPSDVLWRTHELGRARLVRATREHGERQYKARNATRQELDAIASIFGADTLTIGFARRFASYKRATLLLKHPERLENLLTDEERPVQFVFAGKAHPADEAGKNLIKEIIAFSRKPNVRQKIIFLENYDIQLARYMVQGVDVWLNTPRRPQEASGTSGMKAAVNGGLHCSVLDGWWDEGYTSDTGWAIGNREDYTNTDYQDQVESQALYNLLENELIPTFHQRSKGDVPERWVEMMKASIKMALGFFTTHRMLEEYRDRYYNVALNVYDRLVGDGAKEAKALVSQRKRLGSCWGSVKVEMPEPDRDLTGLHVGDTFVVTSVVELGELTPDEVDVQVYFGIADSHNEIVESEVREMTMAEEQGNGRYVYRQELPCNRPGRYGLTARVVPKGLDWSSTMPGYTTWANGA
ncbi:MAG: alpha-glucan family phosphorylase [Kiritimatiellia bacterium]|jgi:starch phosphorylase|nr:alpha-glucan family phosphorylase [Kiritimatiellia bacterium]MDP6630186.1 alpha-glucan family phosphorylase [Kiritimatiellia bacterium]MDP6810726.1 alpha-glucan family phosphorylase [Kiritimatiellia bacterium]MDP7023287.1 alpha-glucan family phosphorylase [Kiritimatiellia bacterium]